jgi:putative FmdB family regulatory protein
MRSMPIYEFECENGHRFEELVKVGELPPCSDCGSTEVRRLLSSVSPPLKLEVRGRAAKVSNENRRAREEQRREGWAKKREGG